MVYPYRLQLDGDDATVSEGWRSYALPLFWILLFDPSDLTPTGARATLASARHRLGRRTEAVRARVSPLVLHGWTLLAAWVARQTATTVTLQCEVNETQHLESLAQARQVLAFFDGESDDPGGLLAGSVLAWRRRKGALKLEVVGSDVHWPDGQVTLARHPPRLLLPTMGDPPFRDGPFPEWRTSYQWRSEPVPEEVAARAQLAFEASSLEPARALLEPARRFGAVGPALEAWSEAARKVREMRETSADFAARYSVFDDSPVWATLLSEAEREIEKLTALAAAHDAARRASAGDDTPEGSA